MHFTNLSSVNLSGSDLSESVLDASGLVGSDLCGANLTGAKLTGAWAYQADLSADAAVGADFKGAQLNDTDLSGSDLRDADLTDASLSGADLQQGEAGRHPPLQSGSDFGHRQRYLFHQSQPCWGARLNWADLRETELLSCQFARAELFGANLGGSDLRAPISQGLI